MAEIRLIEIISKIENNSLVIPDFQRGFKWKSADIKKLLESLLLDYPIGAALLWKTSRDALMFRKIEDVEFDVDNDEDDIDESQNPDDNSDSDETLFILDGQQRITSIYKLFPSTIEPTEDQIQSRLKGLRFFLDLNRLGMHSRYSEIERTDFSLFCDPEVVSSAIVEKNASSLKRAYRESVGSQVPSRLSQDHILSICYARQWLPITRDFLENRLRYLRRLTAHAKLKVQQDAENVSHETHAKRSAAIDEGFEKWEDWFTSNFYRVLNSKSLTFIDLPNDKPDGLARIFETINSTGMQLSVFDLLVARLGTWQADGRQTNLRKIIRNQVDNKLLKEFDDIKALGGTATQQLPRALALKAGIELKKGEILRVQKSVYHPFLDSIGHDLNHGIKTLSESMAILDDSLLPFKDILSLITAFDLRSMSELEIKTLIGCLWAACLADDWEYDTNTKTKSWFNKIKSIMNSNGSAEDLIMELENKFPSLDELLSASSKNSRIYRTILCFNLSRGGLDWAEQDRLVAAKLEDHHIFPKDWIRRNGSNSTAEKDWKEISNSVLNRIHVSKKANDDAGAQVPPNYLNSMSPPARRLLQLPECFLGPLPTPIPLDSLKGYFEERYKLIRQDFMHFVRTSLRC